MIERNAHSGQHDISLNNLPHSSTFTQVLIMDSALESPPSSPLSIRSRSPTPPYPSPSSTQLDDSRPPSKSRDVPPTTVDSDGPPPAKKRKLAEPKPRTTEYLDLSMLDGDSTEEGYDEKREQQSAQLQRLLHALRKKRKIVVIAGAGISVSAGSMKHSFDLRTQ
jgi:NAD-dependent histone deacetylase SIR2